MSIFREYDIRGIYPSELDENIAYTLGVAVSKFLNQKEIVVGRDGRVSSPSLHKYFVKGVIDSGLDVIDIGLVSTPIFYFACLTMQKKGVMITASHNPKEYNGFKICDEKALPYASSTLKKIEKLFSSLEKDINRKNNIIKTGNKKGRVKNKNIIDDYLVYLYKKFVGNYENINVIIDFSNGTGAVGRKIFDELKIKNKKICYDINGNFPCHGPNPLLKGAIKKLVCEIKKSKADLGVIFDGDADRVFFVDEKGEFVKTDYAFAILAKDALLKQKGNCYYDLRFSLAVEEAIRECGGKPKLMPVGRFMKKELCKDKKSVIAGEYSGHIMYKENFGIDDGLFTALKMIKIISRRKKLSELVKPFKKYALSDEINVYVKEEDKDRVIKFLETKYKNHTLMKIDGVSVYTKDFWFNVRKSNTEPKVRLRVEAKDKKLLKKVIKKVRDDINKIKFNK